MKANLKRILNIEATLDSSEAIMFSQGGKHSIKINRHDLDEKINFDTFDDINLSVQIERDQQSRFDFINKEANKHREQWDEINAAEERMRQCEKQSKTGINPNSLG